LENIPVQEDVKTQPIQEDSKKTTDVEELISLGQYNRAVSKELPKEIFKRQPWRLAYSFLFYGGAIAIVMLIKSYELHFLVKLPLAILMGTLVAGGTFLGHELIHGSLVKGKKLQDFIGFFMFAPYMISPTYWRFWHNNLHHGNTQLLYKDPDAFPTKMIWKRSKFMKWAFPYTPGSGHKRSFFYFFWWFSFQAVLNQVYMRFGNKMWDKMNHKKVTIEFALTVTVALFYLSYVGVENFLWLVAIPFMIANYTVMSYISTNHNLSPYTKINDPLMNSLTVTNNSILEFLNLNFGYHTEHHLFPNMPMGKVKLVSAKLKEMYPERYKIMPKSKALKLLYSTPRIYKNRDVLINPETNEEFRTLGR
jgi:fatty acid desaturase